MITKSTPFTVATSLLLGALAGGCSLIGGAPEFEANGADTLDAQSADTSDVDPDSSDDAGDAVSDPDVAEDSTPDTDASSDPDPDTGQDPDPDTDVGQDPDPDTDAGQDADVDTDVGQDADVDGAFHVPRDGTLAVGLAGPSTLIVIHDSVSRPPISVDRDVTIRGADEDSGLIGVAGQDIIVQRGDGLLTLEDITLRPSNAGYALNLEGSAVIRNVDFRPSFGGSCLRHDNGAASLEIYNSSFVDCTLTGSGTDVMRGGAIVSSGATVVVDNITVTGTTITEATQAIGAIAFTPVTNNFEISIDSVTITGTELLTGSAGGVELRGGGVDIQPTGSADAGTVNINGLTVTDSDLAENGGTIATSTNGGGVSVRAHGDRSVEVTMSDISVTGCELEASTNDDGEISGGGGIYVYATGGASLNVSLTDFEMSNNSVRTSGLSLGGAFYVAAEGIGSNATFTLRRGLIANNAVTNSRSGGGRFGGAGELLTVDNGNGLINMTNVTMTGNEAGGGGAIVLYAETGSASDLNLAHATIVANNATDADGGGGLESFGSNTLDISGTIIAGNTAAGATLRQCRYYTDPTVNGSNNVAPIVECQLTSGGGHWNNDDPGVVGSLEDNGGPHDTMLPSGSFPAVDGYDSPCRDGAGGPILIDQRGFERPVGLCDIGAVEVQAGE